MEQDHHPSPQQGPSEAVPETAAERPAAEPEGSPQPDVIMSKLPRTRPQHVTDRRRREQARESAAESRPTALRSQKTRPAAAERTGVPAPPRKPAARAAATGSKRASASAAKARASAAARPKRPRQAKAAAGRTAAPRTRPGAQAPPAAAVTAAGSRPRAEGNGAPSLPRLAVDGAVEAAKLPLRVGGRLTLRALDAIARGLRGS